MYPSDPVTKSSDTSLWKKTSRVAIVVMLLSFTLCDVGACIAFIIENKLDNFGDCLVPFMSGVAMGGLIYTMIVAFFCINL